MEHEPNPENTWPDKAAKTDTRRRGQWAAAGYRRAGGSGGIGEVASSALTTIGGRRFTLALISGAGTFLLCLLGKIDGNAYTLATIGIVGAYVAGNTAQKIKAAE